MRRHVSFALAATVALAAASQAHASITLTTTQVPINATLAANGWSGYVITATASGVGDQAKIITIDLSVDHPELSVSNAGITGPMHQATIFGNTTPTPRQQSVVFSTLSPVVANRTDTQFLLGSTFGPQGTGFQEDNNGANGTGFNAAYSPLSDVTDTYAQTLSPADQTLINPSPANWGVGSFLKTVGAFNTQDATNQVAIAFVIAPTGGNNVVLNGLVFDATVGAGNSYAFHNFVVNPTAAPEPASLGVLALGGLSLLAKRRKRT